MTNLRTLPVLLICLSLPAQGDPSTADPSTAARAQLDRALGRQDPNRATPLEDDPLLRVIVKLDLGYHHNQGGPAHGAYVELSNLGILAAPSLYRALDDLGPFGLNAALELLASYPDQRMTAALDRLLRSEDSSRQILAARLMSQLPIEIVRPLAAIARSSEIPDVQLAGLAVAARDKMSDAELAAALLPLTNNKAWKFRVEMLRVVGERPLPGRSLLPVVEALIQPRYEEGDVDPATIAIEEWARRVGDEGEAAAIALFDRLEAVGSRFELVWKLYERERLPWTRFYVHAATELPGWSSSVVEALSKSPPQDLPDKLLSKLLATDPMIHERKGLGLVMMTRRPSLAIDVGLVMLTPRNIGDDIKEDCFQWLAEVAPDFLLDNATAVLEVSSVASEAAEFFASIDDPRTVRPAAEMLRGTNVNSVLFDPLLSIISYRSTGDDLDAVLDMVAHPLDPSGSTEGRVAGARRALNRWLAPEHLPTAFERLFDIHRDVAIDILARASEIAGPEQRAAVVALLRQCRANWKLAEEYSGPVISTASAGLGAIAILKHIGGKADAATLLELLDAPQKAVRKAAFSALLAMGAANRKRALEVALRRDGDPFEALTQPDVGRDPELRRLATDRLLARAFVESDRVDQFLGFCPEEDRAAIIDSVLRQAEERRDTVYVWDALEALGRLGRKGDEAEFGKWIRSSDHNVRGIAIEQLGTTFSPDAVPFLLEALKDDNVPNRASAAEALTRFESYLNEQARWKRLLAGDKQPDK